MLIIYNLPSPYVICSESLMKKMLPCPTCGKETDFSPKNTYRPFCSERCQLIDLGEWASERFRIPSEEKENQEK